MSEQRVSDEKLANFIRNNLEIGTPMVGTAAMCALDLRDARAELERWREREAACCPEDTGFPEYIAALSGQLAAARERCRVLEEAIGDYFAMTGGAVTPSERSSARVEAENRLSAALAAPEQGPPPDYEAEAKASRQWHDEEAPVQEMLANLYSSIRDENERRERAAGEPHA